jgi:hypothetical protein
MPSSRSPTSRPAPPADHARARPPAPRPFIFSALNACLYCRYIGIIWRYWRQHRRLPDIAHPKRYTERMLWRKFLDRSPQHILFSDKIAAKEFIRARCPDLPLPRTLWVGNDADDIPDELLRRDVYVKASHGCGFNHHVTGGTCDRALLTAKSRRWLRSGYGRKNGEWAYARVPRRLLVEESIGNAETGLLEINIRATNGRFLLGSIIGKCKTPGQWARYLDVHANPTAGMGEPDGAPFTPLPQGIDITAPYLRAVDFARRLSLGVDYARFDFLWNGTTLYGGEITVYPASGGAEPSNAIVNHAILGWDLLQSHFLTSPQTGWRRHYAAALRRRILDHAPATSVALDPAAVPSSQALSPD